MSWSRRSISQPGAIGRDLFRKAFTDQGGAFFLDLNTALIDIAAQHERFKGGAIL